MKRVLIFALAAGLGFVGAAIWVSQREAAEFARRLAEVQATWESDRAALEAELERARNAGTATTAPVPLPAAQPPASTRLTADEILEKLLALRATPGAQGAAVSRQAVYWLEELAQRGEAALPAIRQFLGKSVDVELDYTWPFIKGARDRVALEFIVPPSVRFGVFDVLARIGGPASESMLAEAMRTTGRGIEVSYLARVLQSMAPDKYRADAIGVAKGLLATAGDPIVKTPFDYTHRDHLYSVLVFLGDTTYATDAQAQLVRNDGQVDRGALRYLQRALGAQSVQVAAQAYENPALTNSTGREPLARLALNFVGADALANEFYQRAINDPVLTASHRKNLIEDLNQDGFADTKNLSSRDLALIESRMALIEQLAPSAMDGVNAAAFKEAYKDLVNMRERVLRPPPPK